jgi:hypothetical protein
MSRLTSNLDHQDNSSNGDRVLAIFLGKGFYQFSTYSVNKKSVINGNIGYLNELEGSWNFVYFCYSLESQNALGYVKFSSGRIVRESLSDITHKVTSDYMKLILGSEFNYPSFNGLVTGLTIRFDKDSFLKDTE